jgi:hypothetical protein
MYNIAGLVIVRMRPAAEPEGEREVHEYVLRPGREWKHTVFTKTNIKRYETTTSAVVLEEQEKTFKNWDKMMI